uniref:Uncharacterized protein n=1 Tax=Anoplophora glabripennis TaxID=217634 RepID=V5G1R7_ANOGL
MEDCEGNFKNQSAEFFERISNELKIEIPLFIKNILIVNGLDNSVSFQNLTQDDLAELENFVRNDLAELVDETEFENYFGILYKRNPKKFKFLLGHKKILLAISEHVSNTQHNASEDCIRQQTTGIGKTAVNSKTKNAGSQNIRT